MRDNLLEYVEMRVLYNKHEQISDNVFKAVAGDALAPIVSLLLRIPAPNPEFSMKENRDYAIQFMRDALSCFNIGLTEDELQICVAVALHVIGAMVADSEDDLEAVVDIPVEEYSWLWLLRENCRYRLLGVLSNKNENYERMEELLVQLKPNKEKYEELLVAYKGK